MKTKITYVMLFLFTALISNSFSQTPAIVKDWIAHTGSQDTTLKNPVAHDSQQNVITAGFTMNTSTGGDIIVSKNKDAYGELIWSRQYSGAGLNRDGATCLAVDDSDNIFVGGFTFTSIANNFDFILLKYDSAGTLQWTRTYNGFGSGYDIPSAILVDSNFVYLTGASTDSINGRDYKTIKYNKSTGAQLWVATYDYANLYDIPFGLSKETDSTIVVAGGSQSSVTDWDYATIYYNSANGTQRGVIRDTGTSSGFDRALAVKSDVKGNVYITGACATLTEGFDMKTIKLDAAGHIKWTKQFNYNHRDDIANDVIIDTLGNVYVCGQGSYSSENDDFVLLKIDSSGTLLWARHYDVYTKNDAAQKMIFDGLGNIVLTGQTKSDLYYDFFTIAYSPGGDIVWKDYFDGAHHGDDKASDIKADALGNIYVSGQSQTGDSTYEYITIKYRTDYYTTVPDSEPSADNFAYYPNLGQIIKTDSSDALKEVDYYTIGHYPKLYFSHSGVSYVFAHVDSAETTDSLHRIDMSFIGATKNPPQTSKAYPINELPSGRLNYFLPQCPSGITKVAGCRQLSYKNVYDSIDVEFSSNDEGMKFYFIIGPHADPSAPGLQFTGATAVRIVNNWGLQIESAIGTYEFDKPRVYQTYNGDRIQLSWQCSYYMINDTTIGFTVDTYDSNKPLVIEVGTIVNNNNFISNCDWSSYLGTPNEDKGVVIKTDANSDVYLTGSTTSNSLFPNFTGVGTVTHAGAKDVFVLKFNDVGAPLWETFIGGTNDDLPFGMDINSNLDIFLTGETESSDLPTSGGDPLNGSSDAFVCKLQNDGTALPFLIYFGGNNDDKGMDVGIDADDNLYVVGATTSNSSFPIVPKSGAFNQISTSNSSGSFDGFIAEFDNTNTQIWGSYFGGDGDDNFSSLKIVENGSVLIAGGTNSTTAASSNPGNTPCDVPNSTSDFPDCDPGNGYYHHLYNGDVGVLDQDAIIVEFNSSGQLIWSTYFGGKGNEVVFPASNISGDFQFRTSIVADPLQLNVVYLSGQTSKFTDFPTTGSGSQYVQSPSFIGSSPRAFIAKFNTGVLQWATLFGAGSKTLGLCLGMDNNHNVYMGGLTGPNSYSTDLCTTPSSPNTTFPNCSIAGIFHQGAFGGGVEDGFIAAFNSSDELKWCTYYGGNANDEIYSTAIDNQNNNNRIYLTGLTQSTGSFPFYNPATGNYSQNLNAGGSSNNDAFIARFCSLDAIGINELTAANISLTVFPNPTNDFIQFVLDEAGRYSLEVFDCIGKQLVKDELKNYYGKVYNLDLSAFSNGIYFIRLTSKEKVYNGKFIISR